MGVGVKLYSQYSGTIVRHGWGSKSVYIRRSTQYQRNSTTYTISHKARYESSVRTVLHTVQCEARFSFWQSALVRCLLNMIHCTQRTIRERSPQPYCTTASYCIIYDTVTDTYSNCIRDCQYPKQIQWLLLKRFFVDGGTIQYLVHTEYQTHRSSVAVPRLIEESN